jgi:ABC-2 type transport system ATP-binding protein
MVQQKELVLAVQNVKKSINKKEIIKGISFEVYAGEIFGFLGPNGSGKTTTIRMLVDLIKPTSGSVHIGGYDVQQQHNEALSQVGCIVENPELYSYLTGYENLEHFARMLPGIGKQRIAEVVQIVGMEQRIHDRVKTYSLGMRQRLGIAQALLGKPKLLILDEPTNGLDPQGIKEMREFLRQLANEGLSVFVSSHLLSEIQMMCDRVAIISHGQVIKVGVVDELIVQAGGKVIWTVAPLEVASKVLQKSSHIAIVEPTEEDRSGSADESMTRIVTQMNREQVPTVTRELLEAGVQLYAVEHKNPTLEDLFLGLTEGERIE